MVLHNGVCHCLVPMALVEFPSFPMIHQSIFTVRMECAHVETDRLTGHVQLMIHDDTPDGP